MKISDVIQELEHIRASFGEVEVALQNNPQTPEEGIVGYESFFIVPEEYESGEVICNMRNWPY